MAFWPAAVNQFGTEASCAAADASMPDNIIGAMARGDKGHGATGKKLLTNP